MEEIHTTLIICVFKSCARYNYIKKKKQIVFEYIKRKYQSIDEIFKISISRIYRLYRR